MKPIQLLIPPLLVALFSACSSNPAPPTEADARSVLKQQIRDFSQGLIKLVEFQKTGEKALDSIMLVYATAKIEFLEDCDWPFDTQVVALKVVPGATPKVRKGEQRTVNLTMQFQKTDGGWKATQAKDTKSKPDQ
ncbi:MAG: hypothetical protein KJ072_17335 [Verrucomicrobia bacterium]|nr:hypothetical protein [Verrucomicrobiota bacterium]